MMKKILLSISLIGIFGGIAAFASASSTSCKDVEFTNGVTACVNIEKVGTDRRSLTTSLDNGSTSSLRCDLMTPNSSLRSISSCNGEFWYDVSKAGRIKLWMRYNESAPTDWEGKPSTNSEWTYPQWVYDFDNEEWIDDSLSDTTNTNGDNFYVTASPSDPSQDEAVDITIKSRDGTSLNNNYRGTIRFRVERKSGSSRVSASSSQYDLNRTSYTFTSSDNGEHTFSNLVTFNDDSYDYRLVAYDYDDSGIEGTKIFYLNGDSSTYNADNFYITASPSSPNQDEATDITIKARDNTTTDQEYRGTIRFRVERKSGSSRVSASSSQYDLNRTSYTFTSSDNGEHTFSNLVTFNDHSYDYRLVAYDDGNSIESTKIFYLNGGSDTNYNTDNFYITTDDTTPAQNQLVDLTIKARESTTTDSSYRGNIEFEVRYRASGTTYWTKTTSLTYYEMKYPYGDNGYTFNSSNNGIITITDFIRFRRAGYEYKVIVIDSDYNTIKGEKIFNLGTVTTDNSSSDNLYLSTDDSTPTTSQRVDVTVKSRNGTTTDGTYRGTVQFEVYYKASGSSTWTKTTSSTYYEMKSTYTNGYTFTSSNGGLKTFTDLIRFNKNNYSYKVLAYDENDESIEGYKLFEVGSTTNSSSSSVDGFTSSQLNTVQSLYSARNNMISNMESTYSNLRSNSRRQTMSDDLKSAMQEIIDDDSSKTYDNFTDFYNAFLDRYRYTVSVR